LSRGRWGRVLLGLEGHCPPRSRTQRGRRTGRREVRLELRQSCWLDGNRAYRSPLPPFKKTNGGQLTIGTEWFPWASRSRRLADPAHLLFGEIRFQLVDVTKIATAEPGSIFASTLSLALCFARSISSLLSSYSTFMQVLSSIGRLVRAAYPLTNKSVAFDTLHITQKWMLGFVRQKEPPLQERRFVYHIGCRSRISCCRKKRNLGHAFTALRCVRSKSGVSYLFWDVSSFQKNAGRAGVGGRVFSARHLAP